MCQYSDWHKVLLSGGRCLGWEEKLTLPVSPALGCQEFQTKSGGGVAPLAECWCKLVSSDILYPATPSTQHEVCVVRLDCCTTTGSSVRRNYLRFHQWIYCCAFWSGALRSSCAHLRESKDRTHTKTQTLLKAVLKVQILLCILTLPMVYWVCSPLPWFASKIVGRVHFVLLTTNWVPLLPEPFDDLWIIDHVLLRLWDIQGNV